MIFKSFNSNIDKMSAKWGMFGRSFNDIGTAIVGRLTDIKKGFQATDDLIGSIKDSDGIWKRLYPSKENIKAQLFDVDTLIPEIDKSKASKILETIKSIETGTNEEIKSFQELYNTGNKTNQWIAEYAQSTKDQIRSTDGVIKANQAARESALAHNEALKAQTLSAKAGTAIFKAFAIAGNMVIMYGATKLLGSFINFIDNLHTTLKEQQEITQNLQGELSEIRSDISDVNSELQTTSDRIDELNKKDSLSFIEKEELENLTAQNEELERRNRLLKEQEAAKQQEVAGSVQREFNKEYGNRTYRRIVSQQQIDEIAEKRARYNELYINNGYNTKEKQINLHTNIEIRAYPPVYPYLCTCCTYQWNFAKRINKMPTKRKIYNPTRARSRCNSIATVHNMRKYRM